MVPGCRLPTNKHKQSAYCTLAHAQHDEAQATPHYYATVAGYKPDGSPLDSVTDPLIDRPDAQDLQSLELFVCTNAARPTWPYPRAPPLVAVRCSQLLPRAQLELTRVVLKQAIKLAADNAASGAPAPILYELLSWFRSELPTLLQRLAVVVAKPVEATPAEAAEEEEEESSKPKLTAAEAAAVARNSLVQRTWAESEAQRQKEEEEQAERRRRWEQVKELIKQEEAEKAAAADGADVGEETTREPSPSAAAMPPGIGSGKGGGRGLGRGRVGRGRGDVMWPEFKPKAAPPAEAEESAPTDVSDPPSAEPPPEDTTPASLAPTPLVAATPEQLAPPILTPAQEQSSRSLLDAHERKRRSNETLAWRRHVQSCQLQLNGPMSSPLWRTMRYWLLAARLAAARRHKSAIHIGRCD